MIQKFLIGVQPSDFDHLATRIESLKEVLSYGLKLILVSIAAVGLMI